MSESKKTGSVFGLVLAAGSSRRFGSDDKLLASINGESVIRRTVRAYKEATAGAFVVVQPQADAIRTQLDGLGVTVLSNPDHAQGMSTSLRVGVAALPSSAAAAVIGVGDQPLLDAGTILALVDAWLKSSMTIVVPRYRGQPGNPGLYDRIHFDQLSAVTGDIGGRAVRDAHEHLHVDVGDWWRGMDIDGEDDLAQATKLMFDQAIRT